MAEQVVEYVAANKPPAVIARIVVDTAHTCRDAQKVKVSNLLEIDLTTYISLWAHMQWGPSLSNMVLQLGAMG